MQRLLCVILGFDEILTGFWSNLNKTDTYLQRTQSFGPIGVRYTKVSLCTEGTIFLSISWYWGNIVFKFIKVEFTYTFLCKYYSANLPLIVQYHLCMNDKL